MFEAFRNNPAAIAGALRAVLIAGLGVVTAFWPHLLTPDQSMAILTFAGAAVAASLLVTFGYTVPRTDPKEEIPPTPNPTWKYAGMSVDGSVVIWNDGTLNHFWEYADKLHVKEIGTAPAPA